METAMNGETTGETCGASEDPIVRVERWTLRFRSEGFVGERSVTVTVYQGSQGEYAGARVVWPRLTYPITARANTPARAVDRVVAEGLRAGAEESVGLYEIQRPVPDAWLTVAPEVG